MVQIRCFYFNDFRERCSVVWDETMEGVIIDPGCNSDSEKEAPTPEAPSVAKALEIYLENNKG